MKRLVFLILLFSQAFGQVRISDMTTYIGNPNGGWVPVVISGANRKVDPSFFGYNKIDSFDVTQGATYDTIKGFKNGIYVFYKLSRAGYTDTFTNVIKGLVPASGSHNQFVVLGADNHWRNPDRYNAQVVIVQAVDSTGGNTFYRMDGQTIVKLQDGRLMMLGSWFYTTNTNDFGPSKIFKSFSSDNGYTWTTPVQAIPLTGLHISTPSAYVQPNGNIVAICNVKTIATGFTLASNFYLYKSTDAGVTFVLQDSLFHGTNVYNPSSADRIVRSTQTGRLFYPYQHDTVPTTSLTYWIGGYFYSDDNGNTWTESGKRFYSPDNLLNEPGIIVTKRFVDQSSGNSDQELFYFTNGAGTDVYFTQSIDNGSTWSASYKSGLHAPYAMASIKSIDGGNAIVAIHNRFRTGITGQPDERKFMDVTVSYDLGTTWSTEYRGVNGMDSGFHYFEPAFYYDSVNNNLVANMCRMEDNQHTGNAMVDIIPLARGKSGRRFDPARLTLATGTQELSTDPLTLQIYNRNIGNSAGLLALGSGTGSSNDFLPYIKSIANPGTFWGLFIDSYVGSDGIGAYYSAGLHVNTKTHAGGSVTGIDLFGLSNNNTRKFTVDYRGVAAYPLNYGSLLGPLSLPQKVYVDSIVATASGTLNTNGGSAYRLLEPVPQTIKTLSSTYGILYDSATAHTIKINVDSFMFATRNEALHFIDSAAHTTTVQNGIYAPDINTIELGTNLLIKNTVVSGAFRMQFGGDMGNTNTNKLHRFDVNADSINIINKGEGFIRLLGILQMGQGTAANNAAYTIPSGQGFTILPNPTGNFNVTLPNASEAGRFIVIWCQSTSTNHWSFASNAKDASNATLTTLTNSAFYVMISDGTNYIKVF